MSEEVYLVNNQTLCQDSNTLLTRTQIFFRRHLIFQLISVYKTLKFHSSMILIVSLNSYFYYYNFSFHFFFYFSQNTRNTSVYNSLY